MCHLFGNTDVEKPCSYAYMSQSYQGRGNLFTIGWVFVRISWNSESKFEGSGRGILSLIYIYIFFFYKLFIFEIKNILQFCTQQNPIVWFLPCAMFFSYFGLTIYFFYINILLCWIRLCNPPLSQKIGRGKVRRNLRENRDPWILQIYNKYINNGQTTIG